MIVKLARMMRPGNQAGESVETRIDLGSLADANPEDGELQVIVRLHETNDERCNIKLD